MYHIVTTIVNLKPFDSTSTRHRIIETFAQWTAFSGTRSGSPLKSREDVYPLIQLPAYDKILNGDKPVKEAEFNQWHEHNSVLLHRANSKMPIGWTTKLINLYLKTMVYVGRIGQPSLYQYIHPPIDNGLLEGILEKYKDDDTIDISHFKTRIKHIQNYSDYSQIIEVIELIIKKESWLPIEVELLWKGTSIKKDIINYEIQKF